MAHSLSCIIEFYLLTFFESILFTFIPTIHLSSFIYVCIHTCTETHLFAILGIKAGASNPKSFTNLHRQPSPSLSLPLSLSSPLPLMHSSSPCFPDLWLLDTAVLSLHLIHFSNAFVFLCIFCGPFLTLLQGKCFFHIFVLSASEFPLLYFKGLHFSAKTFQSFCYL